MRKLILILLILLIYSCSNSKNELNIADFNWQISLPSELIKSDLNEIEKNKKKGLKIIEDNYNQNFKVTAKQLFNYRYPNSKFNSIKAQSKILDSTKIFFDEFIRASEIMMSSIIYKLPDAKLNSTYSTKTINGLEFHYFELKIPSKEGVTTTFINYSRLFDNKMLDILLTYQDSLKGYDLLKAVEKSKFK